MTFRINLILPLTVFPALLLVLNVSTAFGQSDLSVRLDSLARSQINRPFNGVVLIWRHGKPLYSKATGFAGNDRKTPVRMDHQFILGSNSKQFTAALVLQESDRGRLDLNIPISKYLPELKQSWADSVTVHQLLNHTSGLVERDKPLAFSPGSRFSYSPTAGYWLLASIIEATSGKSYALLAGELFRKCGMKNTTVPVHYRKGNLLKGYTGNESGTLQPEKYDLQKMEPYTPGAGIISTARDMAIWHQCLHNGKVLSKSSYQLMTTPSALRQHPLWGEVGYGYGIQTGDGSGAPELGHSGYHKAFNSSIFYYPATGTSLVILSNVDWHPEDIGQTYVFHSQVRRIVLESEAAK